VADWVIQVPCVAFSTVQLTLEAFQVRREGFLKYFTSVGVIWNLLDMFSSVLVTVFIILNLFSYT